MKLKGHIINIQKFERVKNSSQRKRIYKLSGLARDLLRRTIIHVDEQIRTSWQSLGNLRCENNINSFHYHITNNKTIIYIIMLISLYDIVEWLLHAIFTSL